MRRILISGLGASLVTISIFSFITPELQLNGTHQLLDICAGVLLIMSTLKRSV